MPASSVPPPRTFSPGHTPRNQKTADYHKATGLEALIGYLYLDGRTDRAVSLIRKGMAYAEQETRE